MLPDRLISRGSSVRTSIRLRAFLPGLLALILAALVGGAATLAVHRQDDSNTNGNGPRPGAPGSPTPRPAPGPTAAGLPTVPAATATHPTGRGRGLARLIPCYTVTSAELTKVLGSSMAVVGQRAAGENGGGLSGVQREDCFWFANAPDGPYVVLSDVTTDQL